MYSFNFNKENKKMKNGEFEALSSSNDGFANNGFDGDGATAFDSLPDGAYGNGEKRRAMVELLKAFPVEITGRRPVAEAIITSGGVKCGEIDPKTMESKKIPGLYFAGEIIDCDAYTGGFNLQIAWATAYAAGMSV